MALNPKNTWYVSFNTPPPRTPGNREVLRITKTFQTEAKAKKFTAFEASQRPTAIAGEAASGRLFFYRAKVKKHGPAFCDRARSLGRQLDYPKSGWA